MVEGSKEVVGRRQYCNRMKEQISPVTTSVGKIWGRDAIYLDETRIVNESTIELIGDFNGSLCEHLADGSFHKYQITFQSVMWFQMIELDYDDMEYRSSFDEVKNSRQLEAMLARDRAAGIGKIDINYHHFVFRTYDIVFQFVGRSFELFLL